MDESLKNRKKGGGWTNFFGISPQLFQPSKDTSDILNKILSWMLKESSLLDFYALASPDECKNYVIFTAKNLNELFNKINIYPVQDAEGKISLSFWGSQSTAADTQLYFRSLKDLKDRKGAYEVKQQELCYDIAFYYIRILQVFAALSLSVLDTEIPSDEQLDILSDIKSREVSSVSRIPPGFSPPTQTGGQWTQKEKIIKNPNFEVLNDYLRKDWESRAYRLSDYGEDTHIVIRPEELQRINVRGNNKLRLNYADKDKRASASLVLERSEEDLYSLSLVEIKYQDQTIDSIGPLPFRGEEPYYNRQTIPRFLKNAFSKIIGDTSSEYYRSEEKQKRELADKVQKLSKVPDQLKMPGIWKSISRSPPIKAYCVSRALQLLSPSALYEAKSGKVKTSICNPSFSLIKTGSLPDPSKDVRETPGILALNLLFFDKIMGATPKINDPEKYKKFINYLRILYNEQGTPVNNSGPIRNTMPGPLCKSQGTLYTKDMEVIRTLQDGAQSLLRRQSEHTAAVTVLIKKLFYITDSGAIYFHPTVQKGGLDEVNRIAAEARDLLIDYYKDCERGYRNTLYNVVSLKKDDTFSQ